MTPIARASTARARGAAVAAVRDWFAQRTGSLGAELVQHWPGASITAYAADGVMIAREQLRGDEPTRQTMTLYRDLRWFGLRAETLPTAPCHDCDHARGLASHHESRIRRESDKLAAWLAAHRDRVFAALDAVAPQRLDGLRAAGATHGAIREHAARWYREVGAALPAAAYRLAPSRAMITYAAREQLEAAVARRMRNRMSRACVQFAWRTAIALGPGRQLSVAS